MDKKYIVSAVVAVVVVLSLVWIFMPRQIKYKVNTDVALKEVVTNGYEMTDQDAIPDKLVVDLRSPYEFAHRRIDGSVNIAPRTLFAGENLELFRDAFDKKVPVVLFGDSHADASGLAMLLRQIGYSNVYSIQSPFAEADSTGRIRKPEEPRYDFAAVVRDMKGQTTGEAQVKQIPAGPQKVVPTVRHKPKAAEGGC